MAIKKRKKTGGQKKTARASRTRLKVQFTFDPQTVADIDAARGSLISRSRWLEQAALEKLAR